MGHATKLTLERPLVIHNLFLYHHVQFAVKRVAKIVAGFGRIDIIQWKSETRRPGCIRLRLSAR